MSIAPCVKSGLIEMSLNLDAREAPMTTQARRLWRWTGEHTAATRALADLNYNVKAAAHAMGVSYSCLYWRSRRMGIPFKSKENWTGDRISVLERHAQSGLTRGEAAAVMGVKKSAVDRAALRYLIDWPHSRSMQRGTNLT